MAYQVPHLPNTPSRGLQQWYEVEFTRRQPVSLFRQFMAYLVVSYFRIVMVLYEKFFQSSYNTEMAWRLSCMAASIGIPVVGFGLLNLLGFVCTVMSSLFWLIWTLIVYTLTFAWNVIVIVLSLPLRLMSGVASIFYAGFVFTGRAFYAILYYSTVLVTVAAVVLGFISVTISQQPAASGSRPQQQLQQQQAAGRSSQHQECSICIDRISRRDAVRMLPCSHNYHARCINTWLQKNNTCPLCRVPAS